MTLDAFDRKILDLLQEDATVPIAEIGERVGLSHTPCWRRIRRLEKEGYIRARVALVDRKKVNVGMTVFIQVKTPIHRVGWIDEFKQAVHDIPEIVESYRLAGEIDYLVRLVVPDIERFDQVYKALISRLEFLDLTSSIVMEELKFTTSVPTRYA
ncbi:Lrp/AsnC family transcriptional regulator [Acuticoccus mangrovi]|uniref:Lrp/AsnC family transcriptional regulator n=1 Tax=Acuticoccus mangrovi TaxID=2796142 RepID=A0A934IT95_9HYPH|nr:Lrp/AsnC family transcriptional regulator [Acuticoccus mangrovi]MBJ3777615.1 Lrp/AsnC family transcriptional regulator [Acuticoccus mangrovi]